MAVVVTAAAATGATASLPIIAAFSFTVSAASISGFFSMIFFVARTVRIPVQKTLLGKFIRNGKEKIVVACKDFTTPDTVIQDFASLKNTIIDSEHNGYGTELSDILMAMDEQQAIDPDTNS